MSEATTLPRIVEIEDGSGGAADESVTLDYDARHKRRTTYMTNKGRSILLDLAEPLALTDGTELRLDDGTRVTVIAAPEDLLEITCKDASHMVRVAWHLGNRHLPTELMEMALRIRADHVIAAMVKGLGADVRAIQAPFNPEGGAYGHGRVHGHQH